MMIQARDLKPFFLDKLESRNQSTSHPLSKGNLANPFDKRLTRYDVKIKIRRIFLVFIRSLAELTKLVLPQAAHRGIKFL